VALEDIGPAANARRVGEWVGQRAPSLAARALRVAQIERMSIHAAAPDGSGAAAQLERLGITTGQHPPLRAQSVSTRPQAPGRHPRRGGRLAPRGPQGAGRAHEDTSQVGPVRETWPGPSARWQPGGRSTGSMKLVRPAAAAGAMLGAAALAVVVWIGLLRPG